MKTLDILNKFFKEKKIYPPITRKKVEGAGYNMTEFLVEIKKEIERADDLKTMKPTIKNHLLNFLEACKDLM